MSDHMGSDATPPTVERSGGCLCGQVRYRVRGQPLVARLCWCRDCQHIAGNGTANAIFPAGAIEVTGKLAAYTSTAASGNPVRRRFCAQCGSHLFADNNGRLGFTVIRLGTLDDPSAIEPVANIWVGSAPRWACLSPAMDRIEGQPQPVSQPQPPQQQEPPQPPAKAC